MVLNINIVCPQIGSPGSGYEQTHRSMCTAGNPQDYVIFRLNEKASIDGPPPCGFVEHLWIQPAAAFDSWDCCMERGTFRSRWDLRHCAKRDFALYIRGHLKLDVGRSSLLLSGRRFRHQCRNSKAQKLRSPNFPMAFIHQELPTSLMELKIVLNLSFMKTTLILSVIKNFSRTSAHNFILF